MTRHELKEQIRHDQFTDTVSNVVEYTASHRDMVIRWAVIVGAVLIVTGAVLWFLNSRTAARQADLQAAFAVLEAPVGAANAAGKSFPTQDAKNKAALAALSGVIDKDKGTREGLTAEYYRGTLKAQKGDASGAESDLKTVADAGGETAPLAKIALAQLYAGQNKASEAQAFLRDLINKPSDLVSKQQAQLLLAQMLQTSNPAEARKIVQSLRTPTQSPAITRAADQIVPQSAK